jgi:geranylgeranyl pyrophosphate synthase
MNRFDEMQETHSAYFPIYKSATEIVPYCGDKSQMLEDFVVNQIGSSKGIRGYSLRKMYELVGGDWQGILPVIAAVEMHLASMYCFNVAADSKTGYVTAEKRATAFAVRDITFNLALGLLSQISLPEEKVQKLKDSFKETDKIFYQSETLDVIANIHPVLDVSDEEIKERYGIDPALARETLERFSGSSLDEKVLFRTYGVNAVMFENLGRVVAVLKDLECSDIEALTSFGRNYGLAMMIINDVQDYSLDLARETTREKNHSDVFSDLRERKVTWPILFYDDIDSVPFGDCGYEEHDAFREKLCENGVIKRTVLEAMAYSKIAVHSLSQFPDCDAKRKLIDSAFSISKLSKYVKLLERRYNVRLVPSKGDVNSRLREIAAT